MAIEDKQPKTKSDPIFALTLGQLLLSLALYEAGQLLTASFRLSEPQFFHEILSFGLISSLHISLSNVKLYFRYILFDVLGNISLPLF